MLDAFKSLANQPDIPDYLSHLSSLTQVLTDSWKCSKHRIDLDSHDPEPSALITSKFHPGDRVFVLLR
ncbi:hypothetical protein P9112_011830 [Eukaryota sp. TZLM1-RC]